MVLLKLADIGCKHKLDILVFVAVNCLCALFTAVTLTYFYQEDLAYFLARWPEYTFVYLLLSISMISTYFWLKIIKRERSSVLFVLLLICISFTLTFSGCVLFFKWFTPEKLLEGGLYLTHFFTSSGWILLIFFYFNQKIINPRLRASAERLKQAELNKALLETEMHLLSAQLEPHFFFNTLANLHTLIEFDPKKATKLLEVLTEYLRQSLPQFRKKFIVLRDEIKITRQYIQIQNIRFENSIELQINIPPQLHSIKILPMMMLTLVENAVKHGLQKNKGGILSISATNNHQELLITVRDNAGILYQGPGGIGLENLKTRLQLHYGSDAVFELKQAVNKYTEATLRIPVHV